MSIHCRPGPMRTLEAEGGSALWEVGSLPPTEMIWEQSGGAYGGPILPQLSLGIPLQGEAVASWVAGIGGKKVSCTKPSFADGAQLVEEQREHLLGRGTGRPKAWEQQERAGTQCGQMRDGPKGLDRSRHSDSRSGCWAPLGRRWHLMKTILVTVWKGSTWGRKGAEWNVNSLSSTSWPGIWGRQRLQGQLREWGQGCLRLRYRNKPNEGSVCQHGGDGGSGGGSGRWRASTSRQQTLGWAMLAKMDKPLDLIVRYCGQKLSRKHDYFKYYVV